MQNVKTVQNFQKKKIECYLYNMISHY